MSVLRVEKVVSNLPDPLEPDAIYAVRVGDGFDFYISDSSGTTAHKLNQTSPVGSVMPFAGSTPPSGWELCFGQAISRTTYATLFATIGTAYGAGNGSTTFNLPDLRGRVVAGKDNMGGSAANRITDAASGFDGSTLGAAGGAQSHTLVVDEMPAHSHTVSVRLRTGALTANDTNRAELGDQSNTNSTSSGMLAATGGGGAHRNVQPTAVLNYIIKL